MSAESWKPAFNVVLNKTGQIYLFLLSIMIFMASDNAVVELEWNCSFVYSFHEDVPLACKVAPGP